MSSIALSPALQDYLEVILELTEHEDTVRVTDIAEKLNIAKASVTQMLATLKDMNMVVQDRYGPICLTQMGRDEAVRVRYRHQVLRRFLVDVLQVKPDIAEKDACLMEHVISPQTLERMVDFLDKNDVVYVPNNGSGKQEFVLIRDREVKRMRSATTSALSELTPGSRGKVLRIATTGLMKKRILEMGVTPGAEVEVKGVAPMGDPIDVLIKGYHLSLRKDEAASVFVEVL